MKKFLAPVRCKICDSSEVSVIQVISIDHLESAWRQILVDEIPGLFEKIQKVELNECPRCHLKFFAPDFYPRVASIYSQLQNFDWYYMPSKWEYAIALEDLKGLTRVLEIGCGTGHFLKRARDERGLVVIGIDLNQRAVREAQDEGLSVYCMDIPEAASRWVNRFDAVCSFQVLEHIQNPKDFLLQASTMLRPGGKLLLGIPNGDSFLKYQFNILDMPPHHLTRWDSRVISYLPNLFPLSIEHVKEEPLAHYHVDQYLEAYCTIIRSIPWVGKACSPKIKNMVSSFLRRSGIHLLLKGHTLYAAFIKNGDK